MSYNINGITVLRGSLLINKSKVEEFIDNNEEFLPEDCFLYYLDLKNDVEEVVISKLNWSGIRSGRSFSFSALRIF